MPNYPDPAFTGTVTPDPVPTQFLTTPTSVVIQPGGSKTITPIFKSNGGRVITVLPTSWELLDAVNFSKVENIDGTVTISAGAGSDQLSTTVRGHYASGIGSPLTTADITVFCSAFNSMSPNARAYLNSFGRSDMADNLTMQNHIVPGDTPLNEDPFNDEGWIMFGPSYGAIAYQADPTATYGTRMVEQMLEGPNNGIDIDSMTVSGVDLGSPTLIHVTESLATAWNGQNYYVPTGLATVATIATDPDVGGSFPGSYACTITNGADFLSTPFGGYAVAYNPAAGLPNASNSEIVQFARSSGSDANLHLFRAQFGSTQRTIAVGWKLQELGQRLGIKYYNGEYNSANSFGVGAAAIIDDHTLIVALNSSSQPAFAPSTPAAVVRIAGGIGAGIIISNPPPERATFLPRVSYGFWRMKFDSEEGNPSAPNYPGFLGYPANDGAGSQKGLGVGVKLGGTDFNICYNPGWIGDNSNAGGPITLTGQWTFTDLFDGVPKSPPDTYTHFGGDEGRGTYHNIETVIVWPNAVGDSLTEAIFRNGVKILEGTWRFVSSLDGSHRAWRYAALDLNITYGGGGLIPPRKIKRYTAELYWAGGFLNDLERPDHFDLSVVGGTSHPAGTLVSVEGSLKDGFNRQIDSSHGWDYLATFSGGVGAADWQITGTNSAAREGFVGSGPTIPSFSIPIRLGATPGTNTITLKLYERANNNKRTGRFVQTSINITGT